MSKRRCTSLNSLCWLALCVLGLAAPAAWAAGDSKDWEVQLLQDGLHARSRSVTNFNLPAGTAHWSMTILELQEDIYVVDYTVNSDPPFHLLAITCKGAPPNADSTVDDTSILGPTETASQFYDDNLTFVYYPPARVPPCGMRSMSWEVRKGWAQHDPDPARHEAYIATSHDRVVRHMAKWVHFLSQYGHEAARAAQFLATALEREAAQLNSPDAFGTLDDLSHHLELIEQTIPSELFDLPLPLTAVQSAQVRKFLQTRLRLRQKLAVFVPDSEPLVRRDRELLRRYR